jgi:hypothetical protein
MLMAKLRLAVATLLALAVLAAGAGVVARPQAETQKSGEAAAAKRADAARAAASPLPQQPATDSLGDPLPAGALLRLGTLRFRPPSNVVDMALAPDEKTIVTVGQELIVWDAATGQKRWRSDEPGLNLDAAAYGVRAVSFAADGARF